MNTNLHDRIDELERKLGALQAELDELRTLARAETSAPAAPTPSRTPVRNPQERLRALAGAVRRAAADRDAASLRILASQIDDVSSAADPAWRDYARRLAAYARSTAEAAEPLSAAPVARPAATPRSERAATPTVATQTRKPAGRTLAQLTADWDLLGARGVALAGGVVTLLGIVFFFVLATNRGWIGPVARVSLGAGASVLLFAAGLVVHRRYGQLHAALAACGAGIAGGYATLAAATILYDLLPAAGALVAASGIAAAGVVVALAWSSQALAALGLLGAALAPAALALDEGVSAAGTAFAAIVFAALAAVAVRREWERLLVAGFLVTVLQAAWMVSAARPEDAGAIAVAAAVVALLIGAAAAWQLARPREGLDALAGSLAATSVAVALGSALHLFPDAREQAVALFAAGAGLGLACALLLRRARDLAWALAAGGLVLAGVATADLASGPSLGVVWAGQSLLASVLAHRLAERRFLLAAYGYLVLAIFESLGVSRTEDIAGRSIVADPAVAPLLAAALAALAAGLLAPATARKPATTGVLRVLGPIEDRLGETRLELRATLAWISFGLLAIAVADVLDGAWLAVAYATGSAVLTIVAHRLGELRLVPFGLAATALATGHALVFDAPLVPDLHPELSGGLNAAGAVAAAAVAAGLGALLLPAAQRGIGRLEPLSGPERSLEVLVTRRAAVRGPLAGLAAALGLAAAGLTLVDVLGDAGHVVTVALWSAAGLGAVAVGARGRGAALAWAGAALLTATLVKIAGHDWTMLGSDQAAFELLICAAAILAAGWLARALSPSREPVAAASAVAAGVSLVATIVALDQLVPSERPAGAALVGVAAAYGALAAAAQRHDRLRNLATAMWLPGLIAFLLGEALLVQDGNVAVAYAATAVALAATARAISEWRLQLAALVVLGGTTVLTILAETPPTRLLAASEHPGMSVWTIASCALAWAALAVLEPRLRERLGWLAAALGLYTVSLAILEVAERLSTASVQTDFERGHTAVSALWGAVGLGLLVAGLLRDSRPLRLGGLALFGISLAKLFLYDLSALSSVTRAFSFLAVGALLLAGGFFLQRLSRRLEETQSPTASAP